MKRKNRILALLIAAVMMLGMFTGCAKTEAPAESAAPAENQAYSTDTASKDYSGRTLRILLSIGGGGNYYEPIAKRMEELYPGLKVEIDFSNTAEDVLRTQVLEGNPPDIYNVNSGRLPWYDAIAQGIAQPIDEIFELPTMDGTKKLGDLMDMNIFSLGEKDGKHYVMHEFQYLSGFWYDAAYFRENNLTVPKKWDDIVKLSEEAEALGKKTLGYMGIAAEEYGINYWILPMIASTDYELYKSILNLDYEAIKGDSMKRVVEKMEFIRDGNYDINTLGCGATEAQIAFINHDHLLYPCGSWLEAEMEGAWTEGWELTFLPYTFGETEGDAAYQCAGGLASMVSPGTKNWDLVCEFYRIAFSDEKAIRESVAVHRNVMKIPGFAEQYGDLVDPSVNTAAAAMNEMKSINMALNMWYAEITVAMGNALNGFFGGDINGDEFIQRFYDAVKSVAENNAIAKYPFNG